MWPPPGFPLVDGDYRLTEHWSIALDRPFARRIEGGELVLWRPGLTVWISAWRNDLGESVESRLADAVERSSLDRFEVDQGIRDGVGRFSYRLIDRSEDGHPVESLNAQLFSEGGQLIVGIYFDDPADAVVARRLVDGIRAR